MVGSSYITYPAQIGNSVTEVLIYDETITGAETTKTITIPSGYRAIKYKISGKLSVTGNVVMLQFNADTGNNYSRVGLGTTAAVVAGFSDDPYNQIQTSNNPLLTEFTIIGTFTNGTTLQKAINATAVSSNTAGVYGGIWKSTSEVTAVKFFLNGAADFAAGTNFQIWGQR
jgi:hypothetical protein